MRKFNEFMSNAYKYYRNRIRINYLRKKGATIGNNVIICEGCTFDNPEKLKIGDNVYIGNNFYANCIGGLIIAKGTIISYNCSIMTYNHDYTEELFMPYGLSNIYREVNIKDHVWIGLNVTINSGVEIGENSIIGMGTTVPKSIPKNSIYAGTRIIKERETKEIKYDLLEVRAPYNPFHFLKFKKIIKKIFNNKYELSFDEVKNNYSNSDYLSMIYRLCENSSNLEADWKKAIIKKITNQPQK